MSVESPGFANQAGTYAAEQTRIVMNGIVDRLMAMPKTKRPKFYMFGESLGSQVSEEAFRGQGMSGPEGVGLLASLDGVGAFMGAMLLAALLKTRWYAATYVGGVACTTMALIVFALATDPMMAGIALVVTGLGGLAVVLSGAWLVATGSVDAGILPLLTILAMASFLPVSEIAQVGRQFAVRFD